MKCQDKRIVASDGFGLAATLFAPDPRRYGGRVVIVVSESQALWEFVDTMSKEWNTSASSPRLSRKLSRGKVRQARTTRTALARPQTLPTQ